MPLRPKSPCVRCRQMPKNTGLKFHLGVSFGRSQSLQRRESPNERSVSCNSRCIGGNCGRSHLQLCCPAIIAQNPSPTWAQEDTLRIAKEVQKRLGSLTNYTVFDWITFGFHGKTVVFKGYASRPTLKSSAANVLKGIEGVESVHNQIEVSRLLITTIVSAPPSTTASIRNPACGNITPTRAVSRKHWDPVDAALH